MASPKDSQDAPGLKQCIFDTFKEHKVGDLIPKIVFLLSDGASVNGGKHSGLIQLIQEEFPWVSFHMVLQSSLGACPERFPRKLH